MSTPTPTRLTLTLLHAEVDNHRDLDCRHYDDCIDRAAIERWTSFSCRGCPVGRLAHHAAPEPASVGEEVHLPLTERVRRVVTAEPLRPWTLDEVHEAVGSSAYTRDQVIGALGHETSNRRLKRLRTALYGAPSLPLSSAPRRPRVVKAETRTSLIRDLLTTAGRGWTVEEIVAELGLPKRGTRRIQRILMDGVRRGHWSRLGYGIYGPLGAVKHGGVYQRDRVLALMADGEPRYPAEVAAELQLPRPSVATDMRVLSRQGRLERLGRGLYRRAE